MNNPQAEERIHANACTLDAEVHQPPLAKNLNQGACNPLPRNQATDPGSALAQRQEANEHPRAGQNPYRYHEDGRPRKSVNHSKCIAIDEHPPT